MTHNMKAFLELSSENHALAARLQMLMLGEDGRCTAATQAAVIRLAYEHGLELSSVDFDYMAPDRYMKAEQNAPRACHCFRNGSGISASGRAVCNCIMYGAGKSAASAQSGGHRQCFCPSAGVGTGI